MKPESSTFSEQNVAGMHDFDFLLGQWIVKHRRLKRRLVSSQDWEVFGGTMSARAYLGGQAIIDDNALNLPDGPYRAVTLRCFDPGTQKWSIWWLDSRHPSSLDPPVVGAFRDGAGTFYADDTYENQPIRVRFIWCDITSESARWEQAFSKDAGKTWEVNWIMEFTRVAAGPS